MMRKIGEYLIDQGFITQRQRDWALRKQHLKEGRRMRLGEILISEGIISTSQLDRALQAQLTAQRRNN